MLDWPEFIGYDDAQLANADIASLNFSCARGLPGMEKYDAAQSLRLLDEMARRVAWTTQAQTSVFINRPDQFYNSYDYFRALVLITVIQRDFGVRYDQAKLPDHVPFVPDDSFLHRVIHTKLGTCANMPVLYIAVGRRLGYPMKLVRAKGRNAIHLFARWDDDASRFNMEATDQGLRTPPDDYYRTGRYAIAPHEEKLGCFLKSLTPREELASILTERGLHLWDAQAYRPATAALSWAYVLAPGNEFHLGTVKTATNEWVFTHLDRRPRHFPKIVFRNETRRYPESFPLQLENKILGLEATECLLNSAEHDRRYWQPMRNREPLLLAPSEAFAEFSATGCRITYTKFTTLTESSYKSKNRK